MEEVNIEVMGDQQGIELVNQSTTTRVCAENRNIMFDNHNTSCRLSIFKIGSSTHDCIRNLRHFVNGFYGNVFHDWRKTTSLAEYREKQKQ